MGTEARERTAVCSVTDSCRPRLSRARREDRGRVSPNAGWRRVPTRRTYRFCSLMKQQPFVELLGGERAELALFATFNFEPVFFEECLLRTRSLAEARRIVVF